MVSNNKKLMIMIVLYGLSTGLNLYACMTTFINDGPCKVAIFNKNEKTFMFIPKNGKRRFGNHHKHAYFAVYVEQPKTHLWSREYVCRQKECGTSGNIPLKFSDIQNGTQATMLFTVIRSKPHSSMVSTLPMIQKKSCPSCYDR